jgi:SusD family.
MKISTINIIAIFVCLLFCSCKKFLEEKPYSFQTPSSYFQNKSDAYTALMGAYNGLGPNYYARHMYFISTLCSDESISLNGETGEKQLDKLTFSATLSNLLALWRAMFTSIMRDNNVIAGVPTVDMDDSLKQVYIGEARFLRALTYFDAVRLWGRVPLMKGVVETLEDAYVEQSSVKEVYDFIIEDLKYAINVLPNKNANGRAGKGSAMAILAKVYLTKATSEAADRDEDYRQCIMYCDEVLGLPEFHLMPDFQKAVGAANEFNPESVFEWQGDRELNAEFSSMAHFALPSGVYGIVPENATGESRFGAERTYYNKFNAKDYRKQSTFITSGFDINGNPLNWLQWPFPNPSPAKKLINETSNTRSGFAFSSNYLIIRLADVYLMKAEAINELDGPTPEAYTMINTIRARARNGNGTNVSTYPADLKNLDQASFREAVLDERQFELSYEGHRWFDLVRTHTLLEKVSAAKERNYIFPIPNTEILLSKGRLTQNKEWQ